jgi:sigma-B regulation protein RsbU (phosphoserine phosphatase)
MLSSLTAVYTELLDTLASAWLAAGATAVTLRNGTQVIAAWGASAAPGAPSCTAPVRAVDGRHLGELCLEGVSGTGAAGRLAADAALVGALADASDALDNVVEALAETEDQLLALYELTPSGGNHLNAGQVMQTMAQQAVRLVKAEGAFVVGGREQFVQSPPAFADDAIVLAMWERLRTQAQEFMLGPGDVQAGWPGQADNLFVAPLFADEHDGVGAGLGVWLKRPQATLSPDLKLARSVAEQAGAQLELALLHQKLVMQAKLEAELDLARQVQLGLLPRRPPQVAGVDVFAESRPALQVGGDFYDFLPIPSGTNCPPTLMFAVGDVSGKGISAALLMAMTRTTLRAVTNDMAATCMPAAILRRANSYLYDDFTEVGMLASVFAGGYDSRRKLLTYANDGHAPVIFRPRNGQAHLLEADGPMLGVLPQSLAQDQVQPFGPGDILVVLTDGFSEAANAHGEFFGIEQLARIVDEMCDASACELGWRLFAEIDRHTAGLPQGDDQTLVVLKGTETGSGDSRNSSAAPGAEGKG